MQAVSLQYARQAGRQQARQGKAAGRNKAGKQGRQAGMSTKQAGMSTKQAGRQGCYRKSQKVCSAAAENEGSGKGEGEGSGSEEGEDSTPEVEVRTPTIFTMSFKAADLELGRNISVRVDTNGTVTTQNSDEELLFALSFIKQALANRGGEN